MLVQAKPLKQKAPQSDNQRTRLNKARNDKSSSSAWEMSAKEALMVNYVVYEHQSIRE